LNSDGTGSIPEGSTYPDISLNAETCTTIGSVLPVTDAVIYSSDLNAGSVLPATDIVGRPSRNRYAGEAIGSMSLSQSVVFSFVPAVAVHDVSPVPLYFSATEPATSFTPNADGLFQTIGTTSGFCKVDNFNGSVGDDGPLSGGDNVDPELGYYWHSIDGYSADTGFGDDGSIAQGGTDEDGDGTDYDRIFGLPAISATTIDPACAASFGFGDSFNHNVAGDIIEPLTGLVYDGCIAQVSVEVEGQCSAVEAAAGAAPYGAQATVTFLANTLLAAEAGSAEAIPAYVEGACNYISQTAMAPVLCGGEPDCPEAQLYAVSAFVEGLCLQAGFSEAACGSNADDPATPEENEQGLANLVMVDYAVSDCATLGANASTLTIAAGGLVDSTDDNGNGSNCDEWAPTVADGFAAQSAETGFQTCTDLAAGTAAACATVTTTDNVPDTSTPNYVYVMNPDPAYAIWSQFVTFNGYAYSLTGDPSFLVNDSAWDLDPADLTFLDMNNDGIPETPYSANGGRLVFKYNPTCVPVIEAMEVQTEFVGIAEDECDNNGDLNGDGGVNVNDIVTLVQYVLGNVTLDDAQSCRADINGDSSIDVLDIVGIVQVILGTRGEAATSATFTRTDSGLEMSANGVVDAIEVTLVHGDNFKIELNEGVSELNIVASKTSKDNETILIVVAPKDGEIAKISGEYAIKEDGLLAANSNGYIATSMPTAFSLSEAYPNPFNPSTTIGFSVPESAHVTLSIYDMTGRLVTTLVDGTVDMGVHMVEWSGEDSSGSMVSADVYIYALESADTIDPELSSPLHSTM
jgi:hypothetical protein